MITALLHYTGQQSSKILTSLGLSLAVCSSSVVGDDGGTVEKALQPKLDKVRRECTKDIQLEIQWRGMPQYDPAKHPVEKLCGEALDAIGTACAERDVRQSVVQSIDRLRCTIGDTRESYLDGATWIYQMNFETERNREFLDDFLAERL